jgi:hypothetical protein
MPSLGLMRPTAAAGNDPASWANGGLHRGPTSPVIGSPPPSRSRAAPENLSPGLVPVLVRPGAARTSLGGGYGLGGWLRTARRNPDRAHPGVAPAEVDL